jgi:hypothetical protein
MNVKRTLLALGFAACSAATLASAPALADVVVRFGPPPPRTEVVPAMPGGWVWVPGYWNWNGHRYIWVRGHREHARRGYHWVEPRWHEDHGHWRQERGRWGHD